MTALVHTNGSGRVLVVGSKPTAERMLERLAELGHACQAAETSSNLIRAASRFRPEAIILTGPGKVPEEAFGLLKSAPDLSGVPILGDLGSLSENARRLALDDVIHSEDELALRIQSALKAQRLLAADARARLRMEMLLEITQAATSSLELEQILSIAVEKLGRVISTDRCSVVLVEGVSPRSARVVASREFPNFSPIQIDLARYPELRRALEVRSTIHVEDAARDPLMEEVRNLIVPIGVKSILVQPLICQDDLLGALFLRLSRGDGGFGREEQEFAQAVAAALANSVRNARLHLALRRKREDLESAYVDRYRELTEANRRLKELNRLKDEVIAVCSHDLRAPLNVLLGHGRLLLESELATQQRASGEAILRQGKKILDLVESLLERGKTEQGRLSLEPTLVDISELCKESAEALEILAAERGVSLRSETPESLLVVGDEVKLQEVLQNLITNAINHARASGEVVVRVEKLSRPDGAAARIVVVDDGPGIPADQLHLVFDRYRHGPGGTGLGLAICKEFIELHGGEIWAETPATGGCAFVFTLPLARTEEADVERMRQVRPMDRESVLVVEDEPEVAAVVAEILRTRYRVEVARDGAEGVAKARALHPDLVVMDVFLPKLDGLDAAVALKSSTDTANIPVILLSAHQGVADKVRALDLGAVDYLSKPFQAMELLARAERALRLRNTERELERSIHMLRRSGSDPETGLFDRPGFLHRLDQELSRSKRYGRPLSLAVLRVMSGSDDQFKRCAVLVRRKVRVPDIVGVVDKGTLAVILPETDAERASGLILRVFPEISDETKLQLRYALGQPHQNEKGEAFLERYLAEAGMTAKPR